MHSLLRRQLRRYFGNDFSVPDQWQEFIKTVNKAYLESDSDREMLERIMDLSSQELLQANSEMRAVFQAIPDLLFRLDSKGTILDYKAGDMSDFYINPVELLGKNIRDIPLTKIRNKIHDAIRQVQEKKSIVSIEYSVVLLDQEQFYEARFFPFLEDQLIAIIRNITDRKKAEDALRRSSELYRTIFENTGSASILIGKDTTILLANSNFEKLAGYSKQEMEGKMSWTVFIADEDLEMMINYHEQRRKDPALAPNSYEFRFKNRSGKLRDIILTVSMIPGTSESVASCMDITERKRAEEELRRSEERYRNILESMEEAYYEVDLKGNITFVNSAAARMIGYSEKELLERNFREIMEEENSRRVFESFHGVYLTGESTKVYDWELITRDGGKLVVEASVYLNKDDNEDPIGFKGIGRNITERKSSEEALRQSEAKYRFLTEKTNDVIWTSDLELNITFVSSSIEKVLGYTPEEYMRRKISEYMSANSLAIALNLLSTELKREQEEGIDPERTLKVDLEFYHKNGATVWVEHLMSAIRDDSGKFIGIHGVSRDITERKQAEEEKNRLESRLAQTQRIESIGTLAGGIAHDFNNILSAIIGYTELAMNDILKPDRARSELTEVLKAGDRAKDLVSQILTFSRQSEKKLSPIALQTVIKESLKMLRSVIPSTIELKQSFIDSGLIMSDPTQINQVILNLCTNAVHAMDNGGGVLEVFLERIYVDENTKTRDLDLAPGPYLRISVSDTGYGMPPEVISRIFDPYFTTKEVGRGTGLGLAVVHGIVKSNGGAIVCNSVLNKGTIFHVYFPELESGKDSSDLLENDPFPTGTERILFVDDEQVLVELAKKLIEDLGYTVFTRISSIEALEFFINAPDRFDLVITDMTMPGMTGDTLTQRILEIRPDIPVILCTGYSEHITKERAKRIGIKEFVMKPLVMKDLAKTIRRVLDESE